MKVEELKDTFQFGMHGCGSYKRTNHVNSLEAIKYWLCQGVKVFEVDIAQTLDEKFVALAHLMNAHDLNTVEINPYRDNSVDKFTEKWFMSKKLCEKTTSGLTPMNLETIIEVMTNTPDIIVMFDLWGLWNAEQTKAFSKQLLSISSTDIKSRSVIEVYNKPMLEGVRKVDEELHVMYCVHGSSADEFDENVSPDLLKQLGVDIISYPWVCTYEHPGEIEKYNEEGFTIFSLNKDRHQISKMQKAGVNVCLVDVLYSPKYRIKSALDRLYMKFKSFTRRQQQFGDEMTVEEVHNVALEMMKEVHEFCVSNEIQYSLAYGSLLGAIRHKGFIPWDDDIDIWMTRPNFEKFTKTFKSKKGYRHLSIYDKDSLLCFDRVYEIDHTYVKNMTKACDDETGIWIDIMLLDSVPDDERLRNNQYQKFVELNKQINIFKGNYTLRELRRYKSLIKNFIYCLLKGQTRFLKKKTAYNLQKTQLNVINEYNNVQSSNYCFFQCGVMYRNEPQELLPAKCFESYQLTSFEDAQFMIVKDYDQLLTILFGDYMTPPPVGQRQKSHGICFWR